MSEEYYPKQLKGRYDLREKLGEGGMGAVFRCHDAFSKLDYAVKFLTLDHVLTASGVQRFVHESRLLSHLQHPNIVQIHDFGVEEGIPYLIMELCLDEEGRPFSLKELQDLSANRQLSVEHLMKILPQMLASVSLLHNQGLIHRDLKPENFLLKADEDGFLIPKLSDFGLVAITGDEELQRHYELSISLSLQDSTTQDRAWVGTYAYMSPEQKRGEQLDARSDVYSLGLIIYRLSTGYERLSPELPSEINGNLPEWLDFLVERALADDPEKRWPTAGLMYDALPPRLREAGTPESHRKQRLAKSRLWIYLILSLVIIFGIFEGLKRLVQPLLTSRDVVRMPAESYTTPDISLPTDGGAGTVPMLVQQLDSPDVTVSEEAAQHLVNTGAVVLPAIHVALRQPSATLKIRAARVAGRIGHPSSVAPLFSLLDDPEDQVRRAAADALGMIGQSAVPALGNALLGQIPHVRAYAVYALTQMGQLAWPAWVTGLSSPDPAIRRQAMDVLIQVGDKAAPGLILALAKPPPASQHAHTILISIGEPVIDNLMAALSHPDPAVRRGACLVLAELKPNNAALSLTELLKDSHADVRRAAHQALVAIGEPAATSLVRLFREADPIVCDHARVALADIGAPAIPALMQALRTDNQAVRHHVSRTMIQLGDASTLPLLEALQEENPAMQEEVAMTLAALPSSMALRGLIATAQDRNANLRNVARRALSALTTDSAPYLVKLLDDDDPQIYRQAQVLLVQLGHDVVAPLQDALKSPSLNTRIRSAEALVHLRAESTYSAILSALEDPQVTNDALPLVLSDRSRAAILRQFRLLRSAENETARQAAEANMVRMGAHAVPVLISIVGTPDDDQAPEAARLLGVIGHAAALPSLIRSLLLDLQGTEALHLAAAEALGDMRNLAAIPALSNVVRWKSWELRREAVRSLGKIGHEAAIPALTLALQDEKSNVRAIAADALGYIASPESLPALRKAAQDVSYDTRNNAALAIRRIQQKLQR